MPTAHICHSLPRYEHNHLASGDAATQEQYRALYERALAAGGLHVTQGAQLWSLARHAVLYSLKLNVCRPQSSLHAHHCAKRMHCCFPSRSIIRFILQSNRESEASLLAADPADEKQRERVRSLWQRQLQVPLADSAETLEQYRAWEAGLLTPGEVGISLQQSSSHTLLLARVGLSILVVHQAATWNILLQQSWNTNM